MRPIDMIVMRDVKDLDEIDVVPDQELSDEQVYGKTVADLGVKNLTLSQEVDTD